MSTVTRWNALRVRLASSATTTESLALGAGTIAFLVVALIALPVIGIHHVPIAGPGSLGEYVAIACANPASRGRFRAVPA